MKRNVHTLLFALFFTLFLGIMVNASAVQFNCENDFNVEFINGGQAVRIVKYVGEKKEVNIPPQIKEKTVAIIGSTAFQSSQLQNITIPDGVIEIATGAFAHNRLKSVIIPNSVTIIRSRAFERNKLTSIVITDGVIEIGSEAFADNQLQSVAIPSSVTRIGAGVFSLNPLTDIAIDSGNTEYISQECFLLSRDGTLLIGYYGNEKNVTIPNGVKTIEKYAFLKSKLESVTIPNSVTEIGESIFAGNQLKRVTISDGVASIGKRAFKGNQLTSVIIPEGVTIIEEMAFNGNLLENIIIPSSITTILDKAFMGNRLTSITIPSSVTIIEADAFTRNQLKSITIGANVDIGGTYGGPPGFFPFGSGGGRKVSSFDGNFDKAYKKNGRKAGTYVKDDKGKWVRQKEESK